MVWTSTVECQWVQFSISLISWAVWSWAFVYVGSLYVFAFWLLLGLSLMGLSLELVNWGSLHPPRLVFSCADVDRLCWSWFFSVYKVLRLLSRSCSVVCSESFLHYLVVFPDQSWISLVWLPLLSSPSSIVICWWFLCWWVSSSSRCTGVHHSHLGSSLE